MFRKMERFCHQQSSLKKENIQKWKAFRKQIKNE